MLCSVFALYTVCLCMLACVVSINYCTYSFLIFLEKYKEEVVGDFCMMIW